ncbi:MAG: TerC family protein [Bdellovibrionales bacterium]|nr:TerC family protein [Bdellovibrionales bacterium]
MFTVEALIALLTLTSLEIVLGIDNIIFIAILVGRLPKEKQASARTLGIALALITRLALLFSLSWLMGLTQPVLTAFGRSVSGRDLILLFGGLFLIYKATKEIHEKVTGENDTPKTGKGSTNASRKAYIGLLIQIALVDIVFSLDSVITAVGMAQELWIMVTAMITSVLVMLFASGWISDFVSRNPTIKMLALSFLLMIGFMLTVEGTGQHVAKGYLYFAMAFSLVVELLNIRVRKVSRGK